MGCRDQELRTLTPSFFSFSDSEKEGSRTAMCEVKCLLIPANWKLERLDPNMFA